MALLHLRSRFPLLKSQFLFFLAFAGSILSIWTTPSAFVSGATVAMTSEVTTDSLDLGVIELTSKNFGSMVGFGKEEVWLIEFYTPSCSHCVNFAPVYENIARTLHSSKTEGSVHVARVNCSAEKALMTRFGVRAFPSFFLVTGLDVYEFKGNRGATSLTEFARGGYSKYNVRSIKRFLIPTSPFVLIYVWDRCWKLTHFELCHLSPKQFSRFRSCNLQWDRWA